MLAINYHMCLVYCSVLRLIWIIFAGFTHALYVYWQSNVSKSNFVSVVDFHLEKFAYVNVSDSCLKFCTYGIFVCRNIYCFFYASIKYEYYILWNCGARVYSPWRVVPSGLIYCDRSMLFINALFVREPFLYCFDAEKIVIFYLLIGKFP